MPDFLIRGLSEDTMAKLKERAVHNGRSLQAEIHATLDGSVRLSKAESIAMLQRLRAELPPSIDSTATIREDRDTR